MRLGPRLTGAIAALGGAAVIWGASGFREIPGQQYGSGFFPTLLGGALILTGVLIAVTGKERAVRARDEAARSDARNRFPALAIIAAIVLWMLLVEPLGFLLTTALMIAVLALILGARWTHAIATAIAMPFLIHLIFAVLLRVPLPYGVVEAWL